jgi:alpha-L-fucosidase 2
MKILLLAAACLGWGAGAMAQSPDSSHDLMYTHLPQRWDEAIPLGNGMLGTLVWEKKGNLHFSLDRADLWDNRKAFEIEKMTFDWVHQKWAAHQYDSVHVIGDDPYDNIPYPTKIPAASLEFNTQALGRVLSARLDVQHALCHVQWSSGVQLETFVAATQNAGYFRFTGIQAPAGVGTADFHPEMIVPGYHPDTVGTNGGPVEGPSLQRLGYPAGRVIRGADYILYEQPTNGQDAFSVEVHWTRHGDTLTGYWVARPGPGPIGSHPLSYDRALARHRDWWKAYWASCSIHLPDSLMERQWYLDKYKLGCVARKGDPPITLQAVWTADEGRLPPWKGDVHNDLNTQLSYWPAFSGNYKEGVSSFTDWLWSIKAACERYTSGYFGVAGLDVPGVCTLSGAPMGGWVQYSLSPTVSSWLAQDFYQQWQYWRDTAFLRDRAYPYLSSVATFLEHISLLKNGVRSLPLSSSPEMHDNSTEAWFPTNTNYDQALMTYVFTSAAQAAAVLQKPVEAAHWKQMAAEMGPLARDAQGLTIAAGAPQTESHRHMSPFMAIYPLGLLSPDNPSDTSLINHSLAHISALGTREWVGYSFCWAGCLFARNYQGDSAERYLKIFATNFVSSNSFHLNGDQKKGQYSGFTYRPFTLEGNFAYAAGVQEMLLQSYNGYIRPFPALPKTWDKASFHQLRAEGGFLIDGDYDHGRQTLSIQATVNGPLKLWVPSGYCTLNGVPVKVSDHLLVRQMHQGQTLKVVCQ